MDRPNIVVILADDLGYGDLTCYGADPADVSTPNMDRLAEQGVRFTDAHSPSSVCTPSRYNLLTGRYSWRTWAGTACVWGNDPCLIEPDQPTIASVLRDGGYETAMVGKWHLGFGSPDDPGWDRYRGPDYNLPLSRGPLTCGFDTFFGVPLVGGQHPHFFIHDDQVVDLESGDPIRLVPDPRPEYLEEYPNRPRAYPPGLNTEGGRAAEYLSEDLAIELTQRAVEVIEAPHERPFFLYFAHRNVHAPLDPHPRFRGTSRIGVYGDFIHELDWSVGEVLEALERSGQAENTLVILTSDNGATQYHQLVPYVDYDGHRANGHLRGSKTEAYEGGHRVPLLARWPGRIPAGETSDHLLALTDLLATCAELAGVALPEDASPDGVAAPQSFLAPHAATASRETLVHDSAAGTFAIRHREWKLILGSDGGGTLAPTVDAAADSLAPRTDNPKETAPVQLFNLALDPSERENVYLEHPEVANELIDLYLEIRG